MECNFKTKGTCARKITFDLNGDIVTNICFKGGCSGNASGIASLAEGMSVEQIEKKLLGIKCGSKASSCPDQLATAVRETYEANKS